ncbi:MAG: transglycosylase SLT domain-containing protein [Cocleimonas sp.]|nr:transglycosylase SLT domain-containing protein [Cocleimonas sp.]
MRQLHINTLFFLFLTSFFANNALAKPSDWSFVIPKKIQKPSRAHYAERSHVMFKYFLKKSLRGKGKKDFEAVVKRVRNRIFWKVDKRKKNVFVDAFHRSYPTLKQYKLPAKVPAMVLLIPYLESLWRAKAGKPSRDYGYWQLLRSIVKEIKALPTTSPYLKKISINRIRSHPKLSTRVALLHLGRYYFYFRHVTRFSKTDAWLFSIVSYNWGSGNVRRLLAKMRKKKIKLNFSNFYHYLYQKQERNKKNRSLRTAVDYLPHLWNIADVIRVKK